MFGSINRFMITCIRCKYPKEDEEFAWKNELKGKRQPWCRPCHKKYKDEHYQKNKFRYRKLSKENRNRRKAIHQTNKRDFLKNKECVDCGEKDPIVLQFDHKDRKKKFKSISEMVSGNYDWCRILEEIKKCVVRCANCHTRRSAKQCNWNKFLSAGMV
jgi:hypothetical protein